VRTRPGAAPRARPRAACPQHASTPHSRPPRPAAAAPPGAWDFRKAPPMAWTQGDLWNVTLDLEPGEGPRGRVFLGEGGAGEAVEARRSDMAAAGGARSRPAAPRGSPLAGALPGPDPHSLWIPKMVLKTPFEFESEPCQAPCTSTSTWWLTTTAAPRRRGRAAATASSRCSGATARSRCSTTGEGGGAEPAGGKPGGDRPEACRSSKGGWKRKAFPRRATHTHAQDRTPTPTAPSNPPGTTRRGRS
jgi:hypothetical protein